MPRRPYAARYRVWLEKEGVHLIGAEEARILEGIRALGSFMKTARAMGVSYAHAWNTVDRMQSLQGEAVVEARRGGESGGGAQLTKTGFRLLEEYMRLERGVGRFLSSTTSSPIRRRQLFASEFTPPDFTIIGSHCVGIDILMELLLEKHPFTYEVVHVGSAGGLAAVMLGECDISGVHLLDEESGRYNLPFLKRYWLAEKAVLVRGYVREQGLITSKHNPKGIRGLTDLVSGDVKFVNRNLGSGTRTLLDMRLKMMAREGRGGLGDVTSKIRGYEVEARSHTEVAEAVKQGRVDVGFGVRTAAEKLGLDFIPVAEEQFDFVTEEKRITKPLVGAFISALASRALRDRVRRRAPGLRITHETGRVVYRP